MSCLRPEEHIVAGQGRVREAVQAARMASAKALRPQGYVLARNQR